MEGFSEFFKAHPTLWEGLKLVLVAILTTVVVAVLLRLERKLSKKLLTKKNNLNMRFVESITRFVLILVAVQWVVMSSPLTQPFGRILFQGTAIIGAIAGFAAQPVIADLICGLMLSATRPFELGDRIELENGVAGIVIDITMRHVVLRGVDTERIVIPNSKLNGMRLHNRSYGALRSVLFRFPVAFPTDVERARAIIGRAVAESPCSTPTVDGPSGMEYKPVYFLELADSSLVMATTVYYDASHPTEFVKNDINTRVKRALDEAGIEIPYAYMNVVVNENGRDARAFAR